MKLDMLFANLRGGEAERDMETALRDLCARVSETGKSGKLTVTLTVASAGSGRLTIADAISSKAPQAPTEETIFFVDDEGNLSRRDPRQRSFDLALNE